MKYSHKEIEKKWQAKWNADHLYTPNINAAVKPFYNLFMFPYPSAEGLHAGHAFSSTGGDIYGRFKRMNGYDVFQPMGYDSFGIHSENYAIKVGETPQVMLTRTTANYERQLRSLGHGYDWTRTVTTSDPDYYKWTQWLFVELFKSGLAYRKEASVNWCPSCKTVLADEQVIDGKCERCGTVVEKKNLAQWFVRITDYADRLLDNLSKIDWTPKVAQAQKQWIGKGIGLNISFQLTHQTEKKIVVWTKYWETIFGATFLVVSPEYLIAELAPQASVESVRYAEHALEKSADERRTNREKTGVDTNLKVINPSTQEEIPVYVADYVMDGVGTGAVMGVPAHDARDFEFAKKFSLPIVQVLSYANADINDSVKNGERASEEPGDLVNSDIFNGLSSSAEGKNQIKDWLIEKGVSEEQTNYHLRDWLISRQRYWGAPIPMIYCEHCAKNEDGYLMMHEGSLHKNHDDWQAAGWYPVDEQNLPVTLPEVADYKPRGEGTGPLADHPEFFTVTCPHCGSEARRETDVMDTFMDSSWYFLRYPSTDSETAETKPFDPEVTKKWLPVHFYLGGAEHAVLHLMYARFVTQVLYDLNHISFEEPFPKFFANGLMIKDGAKMSKSRGNVVNPDSYIEKFGADTLRLYLMFMGPMDGSPDFRDTGIEGMQRFVMKLWNLFDKGHDAQGHVYDSVMHKTIKRVTEEVSDFRYNTAIAGLMEYVNALKENEAEISRENLVVLCQLLAPFAPHLTEEVWSEIFKNEKSIHLSEWPKYDETKIIAEKIVVAVQINGKLRGQVEVSKEDIEKEDSVVSKAKSDSQIAKWLESTEIKKTIYVKGKIVNFVI